VSIYALVDPTNEIVRYVGMTRQALERRLEQHLAKSVNADVDAWVAALRSAGVTPEIRLLTFAPAGDWWRFERSWIMWLAERGHILNRDPGGDVRVDGKLVRGQRQARRLHKLKRKAAMGIPARQDPPSVSPAPPVKVLTPSEIAAIGHTLTPPRLNPHNRYHRQP
jgi:hypothetical protein